MDKNRKFKVRNAFSYRFRHPSMLFDQKKVDLEKKNFFNFLVLRGRNPFPLTVLISQLQGQISKIASVSSFVPLGSLKSFQNVKTLYIESDLGPTDGRTDLSSRVTCNYWEETEPNPLRLTQVIFVSLVLVLEHPDGVDILAELTTKWLWTSWVERANLLYFGRFCK